MNPFEELPDELILHQCEIMDNDTLFRLAGSYRRVYNVCRETIMNRNLFDILKLSKDVKFPNNEGEISVLNLNNIPIIIQREISNYISPSDKVYYYYQVIPDVWIGERNLFTGNLPSEEYRKFISTYPNSYILVKGKDINKIVYSGMGTSMSELEAKNYLKFLMSKPDFYVTNTNTNEIESSIQKVNQLADLGFIKIIDKIK